MIPISDVENAAGLSRHLNSIYSSKIAATGIFTEASVEGAAKALWNSASTEVKTAYGEDYFRYRVNAMKSYASFPVRQSSFGCPFMKNSGVIARRPKCIQLGSCSSRSFRSEP